MSSMRTIIWLELLIVDYRDVCVGGGNKWICVGGVHTVISIRSSLAA